MEKSHKRMQDHVKNERMVISFTGKWILMPNKEPQQQTCPPTHDASTASSRTPVAYSEAKRRRASNLSPCSILPSWPFHWLYLILSPRPQRAMSIRIYSPVAPPLPRANPVKFRGRRAKRSSNVPLLRGWADINTEVLPKHRFALLLIKSGTNTLFLWCAAPLEERDHSLQGVYRCWASRGRQMTCFQSQTS